MKFTTEDIIKYINDELTDSERSDFEVELKINDELKKSLAMEQMLLKGIEEVGRIEFKAKVAKVIRKYKTVELMKKSGYALLALLIGAAAFIYFKPFEQTNHTIDHNAIFAAHFDKPDISGNQRSDGKMDIMTALTLSYEQSDYDGVLSIISEMQKTMEIPPLLVIIKGIAFMETNKTDLAIASFSLPVVKNDPHFSDHAEWYHALALIKDGNIDQAKPMLNRMANNNQHDHFKDANDLIASL